MKLRPRRVAACLFVAGLVLYTPRLAVPARYMFDEVYHAYTAREYILGNHEAYLYSSKAPREGSAYTWNHPPAGILLIAGGILAFGDGPWGFRLPSVLFGAIGLAAAYLLALRLTGRDAVALLAACFLLLDGLYFAQSRIGMLDVFVCVFTMGAFAGLLSYLRAPLERSLEPLLWTGVFLGLAIATKWNGAFAAILIGAAATARVLASGRRGSASRIGALALGLCAIPAAVYLLAYVPFFFTGHTLLQFLEQQRQIFLYHVGLEATHPAQSRFWMWIAGQRPVWYFTDTLGDRTANVYAIGNAVLYLAFVPAVLRVAWKWERQARMADAAVLFLGFFGQWLAWAVIPRIAFLYHFLPAVPFGCIAVAECLVDLARRGWVLRGLAFAYAALVLGFFVFWYPLEAAVPLGPGGLAARTFLLGY